MSCTRRAQRQFDQCLSNKSVINVLYEESTTSVWPVLVKQKRHKCRQHVILTSQFDLSWSNLECDTYNEWNVLNSAGFQQILKYYSPKKNSFQGCVFVCTYVCVCVCMYVCAIVRGHKHVICGYMSTNVYTCICTYVHIPTCFHMHAYTHMYIHTHTRTHTHTNISARTFTYIQARFLHAHTFLNLAPVSTILPDTKISNTTCDACLSALTLLEPYIYIYIYIYIHIYI